MQKFHRATWVEVNLDHIYDNVKNIRTHVPKEILLTTVVKANGYGHGATQVARVALEAGADMLAVAFFDEALSLRKDGITAPVLVMSGTDPEHVELAIKENIILTAFSADWLKEVKEKTNKPFQIHVKLDTGMGRIGIRTQEELQAFVEELKGSHIEIEGAYTHFSTADELDMTHFENQYQRFEEMIGWLKEAGITPRLIHCGNSATTLRFPDKLMNVARTGVITYGLTPSVDIEHLIPFTRKPALSFYSKLSHVKKVSPGDTISYGAKYIATEEERIGTLSVGYADGWIRKMEGFHLLVGGEKAPIVGRVCMDQLMIRLPKEYPVGTVATLIGEENTAEVVAKHQGTINYEVTCLIGARVPRVYTRSGKIVEIVNNLL